MAENRTKLFEKICAAIVDMDADELAKLRGFVSDLLNRSS